MSKQALKKKPEEKKEISLPVLAKQDPKQMQTRLGKAYDKALKKVETEVQEKVDELSVKGEEISSSKEIKQWEKKIDNAPSYLDVTWSFGFFAEGPEGTYQKFLDELSTAETLSDVAKIMARAKKKKVKITITLNVKAKSTVDIEKLKTGKPKFQKEPKTYKELFVENASKLLTSGFKGVGQIEPYTLDIGDSKIAMMLAESLNDEIGITKPKNVKGDKTIPFSETEIPKNSYPLMIAQNDSELLVSWAPWIAIPEEQKMTLAKLGSITPKKKRKS